MFLETNANTDIRQNSKDGNLLDGGRNRAARIGNKACAGRATVIDEPRERIHAIVGVIDTEGKIPWQPEARPFVGSA